MFGTFGAFGVSSQAVRPITQEILGMEADHNLIKQTLPSIGVIDVTSFRKGDPKNEPQFLSAPGAVGRLGIFAAKKGDLERAVILLLPLTGKPTRVCIAITQGFAQASATLEPLGWKDPLSPELIKFCLLKHVVNRWGAQTLAAKRDTALMYIVRAKGKELGPFANDGPFVRQCLEEMASLTDDAFSFDEVEAFTFSSGIVDFNRFLNSLKGQLTVKAVYNIDPAQGLAAAAPGGATLKQYLSGQTGGPRPGFEFMPIDRWKNEFYFDRHKSVGLFQYLHNHAMPLYALNLGMRT
jgi:hypothetical protein